MSFHFSGEDDQLIEDLDAALDALPLEERDDLPEFDNVEEEEFEY